MTKHLASKFQNPYVKAYSINKLTHMGLSQDMRWQSRDLPSIIEHGLWYPLSLYKVKLDWWERAFTRWRPKSCDYDDPIVNEDGYIWAVKTGNNRFQCARYLGYDSVDAIMFLDANTADDFTIWCKQCDPLNNKDTPPFKGNFI